jgi:hypothetical protein
MHSSIGLAAFPDRIPSSEHVQADFLITLIHAALKKRSLGTPMTDGAKTSSISSWFLTESSPAGSQPERGIWPGVLCRPSPTTTASRSASPTGGRTSRCIRSTPSSAPRPRQTSLPEGRLDGVGVVIANTTVGGARLPRTRVCARARALPRPQRRRRAPGRCHHRCAERRTVFQSFHKRSCSQRT